MTKIRGLAIPFCFRRRSIRAITPTRTAEPCWYSEREVLAATVLMRDTVRVTGVDVAPGVAGFGVNVHCVFVGSPEHASDTEPANPDDPLTERS
jgi:hypothetical protein